MDGFLSTEVALGVVLIGATIAYQWWLRRSATVPNIKLASYSALKAHLKQTGASSGLEADYVVVGAGAAGAAAAETLVLSVSSDKKVVILEQGPSYIGSMSHAFSFSHELIGSAVDLNIVSSLPLKASLPEGPCKPAHRDASQTPNINPSQIPPSAEALAKQKELFDQFKDRYIPYPHGQGVGGTSGLDWGVHFGNGIRSHESFECKQQLTTTIPSTAFTQFIRTPLAFAACRSPLSWAFAEAATRNFGGRLMLALGALGCTVKASADEKDELNHDAKVEPATGSYVSPCLLRVNPHNGFRTNPSAAILTSLTKRPNVFMYERIKVESLERGDNNCVTRVIVSTPDSKSKDGRVTFGIRVKESGGVVLACGSINTPLLLARSGCVRSSPISPFPFIDAIGFPIIFEARRGLSDDIHNVHSLRAVFTWFVAQKGPVLNVVTDTMVVLDIGSEDESIEGAQLLVQFLPFGGYSSSRYAKLGLTRPMGVFKDGMTFYISLYKLPTRLRAQVAQSGFAEVREGETKGNGGARSSAPITTTIESNIPKDIAEVLISCLVKGFAFAREIIKCEPLSTLVTGKEALDITLFAPQDALLVYKSLSATALEANKPTRAPFKKHPKSSAPLPRDALIEGAKIGLEVSQTDEYMRAYIAKHSHFRGFGSSTAEPFMLAESKHKVNNFPNVVIADPSAVPRVEAAFGRGFQHAAGVDGAMISGRDAVKELLSS